MMALVLVLVQLKLRMHLMTVFEKVGLVWLQPYPSFGYQAISCEYIHRNNAVKWQVQSQKEQCFLRLKLAIS
jgi:hypothetical protein